MQDIKIAPRKLIQGAQAHQWKGFTGIFWLADAEHPS